ncbi:ester cyclase [Saccharopolyspora cebuensis]|uniref:Ester cyclase n=1 Tax=Saccharopolyspora cebuensis TaxID=418759 RepID=A0ABV4CP76_9PSEU
MAKTQVTAGSPPETADRAAPANAFYVAINRGDLDAAIDLMAPEAVHRTAISDYRAPGVRVLFSTLREVLPDLEIQVVDQRSNGNRIISTVVFTGTHEGSYLGKPATGRPVAWRSTDIIEIDPYGRIGERDWDVFGDPSLWKQLGFIPAIMC